MFDVVKEKQRKVKSWQLPGFEPKAPGFKSLRQQILMQKSLWLASNRFLAADTGWLLT